MLKTNLTILWIIVAAISFLIEISTVTFFALWFGISAILVLILNLLDVGLDVQIYVFIILSAILILASEFILKKKLHILGKPYKTNVNALIGSIGIVTREVDSVSYNGEVMVSGRRWSAISADGSTIPVNSKVEVVSVDGVKLIVKKVE